MANYLLDAVKGYGLVHEIANQEAELKDRQADRALKREILEEERGERKRLREKEKTKELNYAELTKLAFGDQAAQDPMAVEKISNFVNNPESTAQMWADSDEIAKAIDSGYLPPNDLMARFFNIAGKAELDNRSLVDNNPRQVAHVLPTPDQTGVMFNFKVTDPATGKQRYAPMTKLGLSDPRDNQVDSRAIDQVIDWFGGSREAVSKLAYTMAENGDPTILNLYMKIKQDEIANKKEIEKESRKEEAELRKHGWGISQEKIEEEELKRETERQKIIETAKNRELKTGRWVTYQETDDKGITRNKAYNLDTDEIKEFGIGDKKGERKNDENIPVSARLRAQKTAKERADQEIKKMAKPWNLDETDFKKEGFKPGEESKEATRKELFEQYYAEELETLGYTIPAGLQPNQSTVKSKEPSKKRITTLPDGTPYTITGEEKVANTEEEYKKLDPGVYIDGLTGRPALKPETEKKEITPEKKTESKPVLKLETEKPEPGKFGIKQPTYKGRPDVTPMDTSATTKYVEGVVGQRKKGLDKLPDETIKKLAAYAVRNDLYIPTSKVEDNIETALLANDLIRMRKELSKLNMTEFEFRKIIKKLERTQ